jgi:hypothetical protein
MRSVRLSILLLLATIIVAAPVIHTHPFAGSGSDGAGVASPNICAMCAVGNGQAVLTVPLVTTLVVTARVIPVSIDSESAARTAPGTSRAPPAA